MKKGFLRIIAISLVLIFSLGLLVACGAQTEDDIFAVKYGDTTVRLGDKAESTLDALGKPVSSQSTGNCGGLGESVRHEYASLVLGVVDYEDGDTVVDNIELKNDSAETAKGIYIGSSEADVRSKYGDPDSSNGRSLRYESDDMLLEFGITDGTVSSIVLRCK